MSETTPKDRCPACGAPEIEASTPRTVYACGSSDYDGRPGTFEGGGGCDGIVMTTTLRIADNPTAQELLLRGATATVKQVTQARSIYPRAFTKWFAQNEKKLRTKYPGCVDDEQLLKSAYADWCE